MGRGYFNHWTRINSDFISRRRWHIKQRINNEQRRQIVYFDETSSTLRPLWECQCHWHCEQFYWITNWIKKTKPSFIDYEILIIINNFASLIDVSVISHRSTILNVIRSRHITICHLFFASEFIMTLSTKCLGCLNFSKPFIYKFWFFINWTQLCIGKIMQLCKKAYGLYISNKVYAKYFFFFKIDAFIFHFWLEQQSH